MPLLDHESEQPHHRLLLREPALLVPDLPGDASFGMAIPLRRARPAQVMLRHRLLLPYSRLGP